MTTYHIIGDVHGRFDKLGSLLERLGWTRSHDRWIPPADVHAVFVGDLIDRGPQQLHVLELVRSLVDDGRATAIMGNHEFNAVCYSIPTDDGSGHLRPHSEKNRLQHEAFLALPEDVRAEWIEWFKELPIWHAITHVDTGVELRLAHACWNRKSLDVFERELGGRVFDDRRDRWVDASTKGSKLWNAVEVVLKGPEVELGHYGLPSFFSWSDDRTTRHEREGVRLRWWDLDHDHLKDCVDLPKDAEFENGEPYVIADDIGLDLEDRRHRYTDTSPVIFGHHWRSWGPGDAGPKERIDLTPTAGCVDFSAGKDGPLVAYVWNGEPTLSRQDFVRSELSG